MTGETVALPAPRRAPHVHVLVVAGEIALGDNTPQSNTAAANQDANAANIPTQPTPPEVPDALIGADEIASDEAHHTPEETVTRPDAVLESAALETWNRIERAQAGDLAAFDELYTQYFKTVFDFVYRRVDRQSLAEDLTSETFFKALRSISSFTWQGKDFGAWLTTIARNSLADYYKSGYARLVHVTDKTHGIDRSDQSPEGNPEALVLNYITSIPLLQAVKQLGSEQQMCITLRFLHGLSVAETAEAMGKNEGAIKALQYRAVRALRQLLPADTLH